MAQVIKVKFEDTLRRVTVPERERLLFASLKKKIVHLFNLSSEALLTITYTDNENDVVTMVSQADLDDAVVLQGLNPLRLDVYVAASSKAAVVSDAAVEVAPATASTADEAGGPPKAAFALNDKAGVEKPTEVAKEEGKEQGEEGGTRGKASKPRCVEEAEAAMRRGAEEGGLHPALAGAVMGFLEPMFAQTLDIAPNVLEAFAGINALLEPAMKSAPWKSPKAAGASPSASQAEQQQQQRQAGGQSNAPGAAGEEKAIHMQVTCDMCHASPIIGTRYKSTVKSDYDLCAECYAKHGVEAEYSKLERPIWRSRHHSQGLPLWAGPGVGCPFDRPRMGPPCFGGRPFNAGGRGFHCNVRSPASRCPAEGKLDARFVKDVSIFDGTELLPEACFTKIWAMRNSGSVAWPARTRLVSVGGDDMKLDDFVSVQVPESGLLPEQEVEVSVALVAPEKPGRYVSYWRLMAPGGRKFGHRVWAHIQVVNSDGLSPPLVAESEVAPGEDKAETTPQTGGDAAAENATIAAPVSSVEESLPVTVSCPSAVAAYSGLPPQAVPVSGSHVFSTAPLAVAAPGPATGEKVATPAALSATPPASAPAPVNVFPQSNSLHADEEETCVGGFSIVDRLLPCVRGSAPNDVFFQHSPLPSVSAAGTTPLHLRDIPVDFDEYEEVPPVVVPAVAAPLVESGGDVKLEELLVQLEAMGFSDWPLNAALLNDYAMDLQETLDALVAVGEWDPMVEELTEMGFSDANLNRRLLLKNKGSVRSVVKELVKQYKAANGRK